MDELRSLVRQIRLQTGSLRRIEAKLDRNEKSIRYIKKRIEVLEVLIIEKLAGVSGFSRDITTQ